MEETNASLEREHALLKQKYAELEVKYISEKKTQAIRLAMKGIKYNSRDQVVKLAWDDLKYDPATDELTAPGFKTTRDYFRDRATKYPYELVGGQPSKPLLKRSEMSTKQKADYIEEHGMDDYFSLPK